MEVEISMDIRFDPTRLTNGIGLPIHAEISEWDMIDPDSKPNNFREVKSGQRIPEDDEVLCYLKFAHRSQNDLVCENSMSWK